MPVLEQPTDVLRQFSHGDLDAFEALFRTHQSEVYGWIVRIVRDPAAASAFIIRHQKAMLQGDESRDLFADRVRLGEKSSAPDR